jgi:nucleotide-binding universal stress UspA family protein
VITGHAEEEKNRLHMYGLQAQKFLEAGKVKTKFETMEGKSSYKLVTEYAKKVKADLIVIMTEQESESLFMGPTAQQMIHHSPYPVMSVKPHEVNISYAQL